MDLNEWIKNYLISRDTMEQMIVSIEDKGKDLVVHRKNGDVVFLIRPDFSNVEELKIPGKISLVILNSRKNLDFVISNWQMLSAIKELCIYFVNPTVSEKWLLYPYTHNQITEKTALKRGLLSLFSTVPAV